MEGVGSSDHGRSRATARERESESEHASWLGLETSYLIPESEAQGSPQYATFGQRDLHQIQKRPEPDSKETSIIVAKET